MFQTLTSVRLESGGSRLGESYSMGYVSSEVRVNVTIQLEPKQYPRQQAICVEQWTIMRMMGKHVYCFFAVAVKVQPQPAGNIDKNYKINKIVLSKIYLE